MSITKLRNIFTSHVIHLYKINNMGDERLPKIVLKSNQTHLRLKCGWCKYTMAWLNHSGIDENEICRISIMSKILLHLSLKRKRGARKDLEDKRQLKYSKEVSNPNLELGCGCPWRLSVVCRWTHGSLAPSYLWLPSNS